MSAVIEPTSQAQALSLLQSKDLPVLVDFYATWCGPCKALAPVLSTFAQERAGRVNVLKLDVDQFQELAGQVGIRSVPTLLVVRDGQVIAAQSGALPKAALDNFVDRALGQ